MDDIISITSHKGYLIGLDEMGRLHTPAIFKPQLKSAFTPYIIWPLLEPEEIERMGLTKAPFRKRKNKKKGKK